MRKRGTGYRHCRLILYCAKTGTLGRASEAKIKILRHHCIRMLNLVFHVHQNSQPPMDLTSILYVSSKGHGQQGFSENI